MAFRSLDDVGFMIPNGFDHRKEGLRRGGYSTGRAGALLRSDLDQ
jgi:hypothetical protein